MLYAYIVFVTIIVMYTVRERKRKRAFGFTRIVIASAIRVAQRMNGGPQIRPAPPEEIQTTRQQDEQAFLTNFPFLFSRILNAFFRHLPEKNCIKNIHHFTRDAKRVPITFSKLERPTSILSKTPSFLYRYSDSIDRYLYDDYTADTRNTKRFY